MAATVAVLSSEGHFLGHTEVPPLPQVETYEAPDRAPSDGPNMIPLDRMPALVESLMQFDRLAKANPLRVQRAVSPRVRTY